jgi:endonuclease/exonuclease/phosphatase family metal-dependent hydrolase
MRLVTFNILHGRSLRDGLVDLDRLATVVRELNPDVLALQEVDSDQPRSHGADLTAVAAQAMGAVAYRFVPAMSGLPGPTWLPALQEEATPGAAAYGIALLSRYPATDWRVWRLPRIRFPVPDLRPSAGLRRVASVRDELRTVVVAQLDTPLGPLTVANTHLSFIPGWGRRQLYRIKQQLALVPASVVLMGDLNLPGSIPTRITGYRPLAAGLTFPAAAPRRQIDHILLRGRLGEPGPVRAEAPELALSDHRALVAELAE